MHPFERRQVLVEEGVGGDQRPESDQQPLTAQRIAWQEARGRHALRIVARWSDRHRNALELTIFRSINGIFGYIITSRPRSRNGGFGLDMAIHRIALWLGLSLVMCGVCNGF